MLPGQFISNFSVDVNAMVFGNTLRRLEGVRHLLVRSFTGAQSGTFVVTKPLEGDRR